MIRCEDLGKREISKSREDHNKFLITSGTSTRTEVSSTMAEKTTSPSRLWLPALITGDSDKEPVFLSFRCSKTFIIFAVSLSVFTDIFLYAVVVPVLPFALHDRAGVSQDPTQYWVSILLAVYGAALLVASPICGWISDRISMRRLPFLFGLVTVAGATLFLTLGQTLPLLIIGRLLQGISAAIVWTAGIALLVDTVGSQKDIGYALGFVALSMSAGLLVAPLLGGIVFSKGGFYQVFAMCFGLLALDIICRLFMIERKVAKKWLPSFHSRQHLISGMSAQQSRIASRLQSGATTPQTDLEYSSSTISSGDSKSHIHGLEPTTIRLDSLEDQSSTDNSSAHNAQSKQDHDQLSIAKAAKAASKKRRFRMRLPPVLSMLKSRRLLASLWGTLVQAVILTAFDSTLPLRVRKIWGWDSLGAGLIFIPVALASFASPIFGHLSDRYGPKWPCTSGFVLACPFLVLLRLVDHDSIEQKVIMCVLLAFIGVSLGMTLPALMSEITYAVEEKERNAPPGTFGKNGAYAQGYALFNVAYAGGCLVGPIWGGMIVETAGWGTMAWSLGLLSIATAVPTALLVGGKLFGNKRWVRRTTRSGDDDDDFGYDASGAQSRVNCQVNMTQPYEEALNPEFVMAKSSPTSSSS